MAARRRHLTGILWLSLFMSVYSIGAGAQTPLRIGFIDPALPGETPRRNAAALLFARKTGECARLMWTGTGGWHDGSRARAPEEFDVLWFHQGDDPAAAALGEAACADLAEYLEGGGTLLLSGSAGALLNELGIESTPLRVLPPTGAAYVSGILVPPNHRDHPAFAGLDTTRPLLLTSLGGNALADFYGTDGPHGELLADGNAGLGERPLVEYRVGAGRVIFIGWRLPDFTTAGDSYRPNLERLFGNLLRYLAARNTNKMRLLPPPGGYRYERLFGVPFLRAEKPFPYRYVIGEERWGVFLLPGAAAPGTYAAGDAHVAEEALTDKTAGGDALAVTLTRRERPVSSWLAARRAAQEAAERRDRESIGGLKVVKTSARLLKAPLKPLKMPDVEQSVLLGHSPFMAPGDGKGDITPVYEPLEDGGFRITNSRRTLNRPIIQGQNRVWTGDAPLFRMDTSTGNGTYSADKVFPLWPRPDAQAGSAYPCMGTLRLGVPGADGRTQWLDELPGITTTFRPGYTEYAVPGPAGAWKAAVTVAPSMNGHGMLCRVEFDRETPLVWQFGGMWWQPGEGDANRVEITSGPKILAQISGSAARITEPNLPNGVALAGWDGAGEGKAVAAPFGQQAEFTATQPRRVYHLAAVWGLTTHDSRLTTQYMARLDTKPAADWPEARDLLKRLWYDCYVRPALDPEKRLRALLADPEAELKRAREGWDRRREEFQIRTPDPHLNALINWERCASEYHRQGPGLVLGAQYWIMYSHISTGWYGKEWGGDHPAMEQCLRLYAAMQRDDGFIRWVSPSLFPFDAEDNTPYWVDQVWRHYTWTGDRQFLHDLWPAVRRAVDWLCRTNDTDGDGLFQDWYEYWNCDSNGKGPKAAAPSAMAWAALDRAAKMAAVVGDAKAAREYRAKADRTRQQVFAQLWREDRGRLGSIGAEGFWRGHPQTWEEYLAINAGLLPPDRGRRAMRWLLDHYGFEPQPGVKLLACSDWWPIRWSTQWVPTGDTLLAALAGMKCGDIALWWPYIRTVVMSAFKSDFPGINMGISNAGAGGGDREDVDSADPHVHMAARGLFGIEPALDEGRLDICPAFPPDWKTASIRTPDISYEYRREGNRAVFRIRTPRPTVKHVRANLYSPMAVTHAETESVVTVALTPLPRIENPKSKIQNRQILAEQQPPTLADTGAPLTPAERARQVLFDLSDVFNLTSEEMTATKFLYDYSGTTILPWTGSPQAIAGWWGNPALSMPASPRVLQASNGVKFLTVGRPRPGTARVPKNLLALSSWRPYPLPGGAAIPVGLRCERLWLLLQSYVHPMKNYVPNGEVVLRYADGKREVVSLIPPFNLDCYFQHFSRQGVPVPLGRLGPSGFIHEGMLSPHADALQIQCDPARVLESVELRATVSEGVLGLAGLTALEAD